MSVPIIPELHAIFVHFTIGLLILSVVLQLLVHLIPKMFQIEVKEEISIMSKWCLWFGVGFSLFAIITGFFAFYAVPSHNAFTHSVMDWHRNWALSAFGLFVLLGAWSYISDRKTRKSTALFLVILFLGGVALAETARRGGDLVYKYGIGVEACSIKEAPPQNHGHLGSM